MTHWFITRHAGARAWAERQGVRVDHIAAHLDPDEIGPGDVVIGSLPVHLAAEVCARGARYLHLTLDLPPHLRGLELSPEQMEACGARLRGYLVREAPEPTA